ncbi:MAG: ImmA/IrrE family metallo-endopeptidase [Actinomycetales bacterium]
MDELRELTLEPDAQVFVPEVSRICADLGVVVIFIPDVSGSRCSGAARWVGGRPVIQLSMRNTSDDHLWFTLFHELGHVVLHSRRSVFIDDGISETNQILAIEKEADAFARQALIPADHESELANLRGLGDIEAFAQRVGVSPGVVVGRLQHDHVIGNQIGNRLKRRYRLPAAS